MSGLLSAEYPMISVDLWVPAPPHVRATAGPRRATPPPEAVCAQRCGACPIPTSSGRTPGRHRWYRGGHRQATAALSRAAIARMRFYQPTVDSVARRSADGRTTREIIRCRKRFLARERNQRVMTDVRRRQRGTEAA